MMNALRILIAGIVLTCTAVTLSQNETGYSEGGTELCVSCHNFGPESPLMTGPHGGTDLHGCEDCHGPSADHANSPVKASPGVGFGPSWTNTVAAQDSQCLACHEEDIARHWEDALHMLNELTCVSCHDIHTETDPMLAPRKQAQACTECHEAQKQGIHELQEATKNNPGCSSCHDPHGHESAKTEMLKNRSKGCRTCHDLVEMAESDKVSDKSKSYHKVMVSSERTCTECHSGIAHAPIGLVTSFVPQPGNRSSGKNSDFKVEVAPK